MAISKAVPPIERRISPEESEKIRPGGSTKTGTPVRNNLPHSHLWDYLYKLGDEPHGYAMYTYVLVGRDTVDTDTWNRYEKLIESIMSSTSSSSDLSRESTKAIDKSNFNVFLIPNQLGKKQNLNVRLSKFILTSLAASSTNSKLRKTLNNPGPFLISMLKPLGRWETDNEVDVLYVDLTRSNEAASNEIVKAYKEKLSKSEIKNTEEYLSIKLAALSIILNGDDYIKIIKSAAAKSFYSEPTE